MKQPYLVGGILPNPLKNMKVSWDDDSPNIWKVIKAMFQTTKQLKVKFKKKNNGNRNSDQFIDPEVGWPGIAPTEASLQPV
jgi:hypothetical protein